MVPNDEPRPFIESFLGRTDSIKVKYYLSIISHNLSNNPPDGIANSEIIR